MDLDLTVMEDKAHKAHHPAQSGAKAEKKAKGKGKADHGKGYNEKVRPRLSIKYLLMLEVGICAEIWEERR